MLGCCRPLRILTSLWILASLDGLFPRLSFLIILIATWKHC